MNIKGLFSIPKTTKYSKYIKKILTWKIFMLRWMHPENWDPQGRVDLSFFLTIGIFQSKQNLISILKKVLFNQACLFFRSLLRRKKKEKKKSKHFLVEEREGERERIGAKMLRYALTNKEIWDQDCEERGKKWVREREGW